MECENNTGGIDKINYGRVTFCEEIKKQYDDNTVDLTTDNREHKINFCIESEKSKKEIINWTKEIKKSIVFVKEEKLLSVEQRLEKIYEEKAERAAAIYNKTLYL